jgi:hypothetical protein
VSPRQFFGKFHWGRTSPLGGARWLALALCAACGSDPTGFSAESAAPVAGEDVTLPRFGLVALESKAARAEQGTGIDADAFFWRQAGHGEDGCEVVDNFESCEVTECVPSAVAAASMQEFAWLSAGTVDVFGTKLAFSFRETSAGSYVNTLPARDLKLWDGGERLTVTAAGSAQFPALEAALVAPSGVTLTMPQSAELAVDPRAGLRLSWSSPSRDAVFVDIEERRAVPYAAPTEVSVRCAFAGEAGGGFVPPEVFGAFSDAGLLAGYRFWVSTESRTEVTADGATLTFLAWSESARFDARIARDPSRPHERAPIASAAAGVR